MKAHTKGHVLIVFLVTISAIDVIVPDIYSLTLSFHVDVDEELPLEMFPI